MSQFQDGIAARRRNVARMHRAGMSQRQIAAELHVSQATVRRDISEMTHGESIPLPPGAAIATTRLLAAARALRDTNGLGEPDRARLLAALAITTDTLGHLGPGGVLDRRQTAVLATRLHTLATQRPETRHAQ